MKTRLKPALLAAALAAILAIATPATATIEDIDPDVELLVGWQEDKDLIDSLRHDPDPGVQRCAAEMDDDMAANRGAIIFGFPSVIRPLLPAANHYRENTIMPWFHDCVNKAREATENQ